MTTRTVRQLTAVELAEKRRARRAAEREQNKASRERLRLSLHGLGIRAFENQAACSLVPLDVLDFSESLDAAQQLQAKAVCAVCAAFDECEAERVRLGSSAVGIWAGVNSRKKPWSSKTTNRTNRKNGTNEPELI